MDLYIANCTKQILDFNYRLPEEPAMRRQQIPIGSQIKISGALNDIQRKAIIEQNERYGLTAADKIDQSRPFVGMIYSDKPIPDKRLIFAVEHNDGVLIQRGIEMRKQAGLAVHNVIQQNTGGALRELEISVQEDVKDGGTPKVNEGLLIGADAPMTPTPVSRRNRRGRR